MNGDGILDLVACDTSGGLPEGSVLLAISGKDETELWRVNGADAVEGSKMVRVDAKTGKTVSTYTDIKFGHAIALLPDINGDGIGEIATGHPTLYNKEIKTSGCIYVFSGKDGSIVKKISSPDKDCRIGLAIAPYADINFDGVPDILAGDPSATVDGRKEVGRVVVIPM